MTRTTAAAVRAEAGGETGRRRCCTFTSPIVKGSTGGSAPTCRLGVALTLAKGTVAALAKACAVVFVSSSPRLRALRRHTAQAAPSRSSIDPATTITYVRLDPANCGCRVPGVHVEWTVVICDSGSGSGSGSGCDSGCSGQEPSPGLQTASSSAVHESGFAHSDAVQVAPAPANGQKMRVR